MQRITATWDEGNGQQETILRPGALAQAEKWLGAAIANYPQRSGMYATWWQARGDGQTDAATYDQFAARLLYIEIVSTDVDPTQLAASPG